MLQIEIDGKELSVEQGSTVMEAAHQIGTYIPHFCYHKKLSIAANCRMCLVEVEKAPKPLPACATPVTDGMKVKTNSPLAKKAQEGVMEFLLINHPLDCPICDQGGECQLQDLSVGYGQSAGRYQEEKRSVVGKDMGPLVSAQEMSRCIHCTRCARFTEEIAGYQEIGMANRGEFSEIMPYIGKTVESEISGNVIDLCPVGALTSKPFRYDARSWELSRRKSFSAHDALGTNLIVQVKDHRVRRVLPLENEAINECWISDKDRFSYEGLYHEQRLQKPKIKHGGQWHEVDWQTALEYAQKGIRGVSNDFGADAIGVLANPMSTVEELYLTKKLAHGLGIHSIDSRLQQQDLRFADKQQGALWLGQSIADFAKSDAVLMIGADLRQEQPLLTARIRQSVKEGMSLFTLNAHEQTLHMKAVQSIANPSDWAAKLAEILSAVKGEGLASESAMAIATALKEQEAVSVVLGAAAQNHADFAHVYFVAQELAEATGAKLGILPQAANSVGADVLGFVPSNNGSDINAMFAKADKKAFVLLNVEPEIDVANVQAAKKALMSAQTVIAMAAFESEGLLELADVLLPITPFTETSGSFISMEGRLQSFHGVVRPLGEARPAWKVLRVLGNMLGVTGFEYNASEEVLSDAIDTAELANRLNSRLTQSVATGAKQDALVRVGGVSIYSTDAISRRSAPLQATTHAQVPVAKVNAGTLAKLGVTEGSVQLATVGGDAITVTVAVDNQLPENVVYLPVHPANQALGNMMATVEFKRG